MRILKLLSLIFLVLVFSCKKERIENEVIIRFNNGSGDFICGEWCGTTIEIVNGSNFLKSKYNLPEEIVDKREWWNKEYIATIKFLNENCNCMNGLLEPHPPGSNNFPQEELKMVEIVKIRPKYFLIIFLTFGASKPNSFFNMACKITSRIMTCDTLNPTRKGRDFV